jgi:acyl transferase domain-containing protein
MNDRVTSHAGMSGAALDGIAVIGLAGRFPGASDVRQFWSNLCNGNESIRRFAPEEIEDAFTAAERADRADITAR